MAAIRRKEKKEVDLDSLVASGPSGAYEALQLYRSRSLRFKSKENINEAVKEAAKGAKSLLSRGYTNAGAELAEVFIDCLNEKSLDLTPQLRDLIFDIDSDYPPSSPLRIEFLKGCVKYSIANGTRELGEPALHLRLGHCLWDNNPNDVKNAIYHFVLSEEPGQLAQKICDTYCLGTEVSAESILARDRALTLGILHFLALENLRDAFELFKIFKKIQKAHELPITGDLIVFNDYLLQVSRRDAAPLFKSLVNAYLKHLQFDETAETLLMGPIASRLFNIQPKANPVMSMLQNLLT
mmetsp:Transcript_10981/g.9922  ORF Transcript_10981/g.9922 Transcript_10981/m.9922 type:complete len:296 (-) Transcript_10981:424-1311(-)|eukprot:CAMPEP_0196761432 /NCGR_PEP_ID=MMETSP1095-20130614/675_1 /TAXON_ID=96789 ORGANISM="Chromulina nebulosa, Strain UTEXLB2642" /NCGR_SAMPLE_ID=MMETSP1095 /ASSEMBLY_ACC=CAM_ASM_000446 /LENGTH=295 /DNA_ID=CAMNT_0042110987 /DNA_START=21 /DNA_END=908 /DNA_ORIENTATION=+